MQTINALGVKARDGTLSIDEMAGGTFTISNGGVFGWGTLLLGQRALTACGGGANGCKGAKEKLLSLPRQQQNSSSSLNLALLQRIIPALTARPMASAPLVPLRRSMLSTPIINPPQSAILGMHATTVKPAVVNGQIVARCGGRQSTGRWLSEGGHGQSCHKHVKGKCLSLISWRCTGTDHM